MLTLFWRARERGGPTKSVTRRARLGRGIQVDSRNIVYSPFTTKCTRSSSSACSCPLASEAGFPVLK